MFFNRLAFTGLAGTDPLSPSVTFPSSLPNPSTVGEPLDEGIDPPDQVRDPGTCGDLTERHLLGAERPAFAFDLDPDRHPGRGAHAPGRRRRQIDQQVADAWRLPGALIGPRDPQTPQYRARREPRACTPRRRAARRGSGSATARTSRRRLPRERDAARGDRRFDRLRPSGKRTITQTQPSP